MHDDLHLVAGVLEEVLGVLVPYVPGVVVADLRDDVAPLEDALGGRPESHLKDDDALGKCKCIGC